MFSHCGYSDILEQWELGKGVKVDPRPPPSPTNNALNHKTTVESRLENDCMCNP